MNVLFSPLGFNYGVLYSAILLIRPSRVVVVTSKQAIVHLHPALDAAKFFHSKFEVETHMLDDPFGGFEEGRLLSRLLASSAGSLNTINLTGGTAAMQDCMHSISSRLRTDGKKVREVAVIDRRNSAEQKRAPLVVGELIDVPCPTNLQELDESVAER
jgi:hypothetical protein